MCRSICGTTFDYEAYGRDIRINDDGHFAPGGYVMNNGGKFIEHYNGLEDIPRSIAFFPIPSSMCGNRWPPIKKSLTARR